MLSEVLRHHALLVGPGIFIPCQLFAFQETLAFRNPKAIWNFWFCRLMWMGQKRLLSTNSWRPAKEEESWVIVSSGTLASFWWTKRGMLLTATHLPPLPSRLRWNPCLSVLSTSCFWCIVVSCSYTPGDDLEPFNVFLFSLSVNIRAVLDNAILLSIISSTHHNQKNLALGCAQSSIQSMDILYHHTKCIKLQWSIHKEYRNVANHNERFLVFSLLLSISASVASNNILPASFSIGKIRYSQTHFVSCTSEWNWICWGSWLQLAFTVS